MVLQQLYAYLIHLLAGLAVVGVFVAVYLQVTPFREIQLICDGGTAAALSLAGATLGFALTVASSILHNDTFLMFLFWAACSAAVQVVAYALVSRSLPGLNAALENNNVAMGGLMGVVSLVVGIINAAALS
ncbi:MAG: surface protein [Rhodocyclales bacterium]|nr:surface protein [Rhodocyclales bacterium]